MTTDVLEPAPDLTRTKRLRAQTHAAHEDLDARIMDGAPFADRERYLQFLHMQYLFHRDIDALYDDQSLTERLPDLPVRRRLEAVTNDLADLGATPPADLPAPLFPAGQSHDLPTALGWLYAAEGSKLGAAFLLKASAALGFSGEKGARHLEAAEEGRGLHWRTFTSVLDDLTLDEAAEERMYAGGRAAFARVRALAEAHLPKAPAAASPAGA
ncbi:biliverdin-producing heme oxygenase [Xanthobacteraceae bacterium A53D]